jgi:hypothetical protein
MKNTIALLILTFLISFGNAQTKAPQLKLAVVNLADTVISHIYGNRWYSTTFEKDNFNYYRETTRGLENILPASIFSVTTAQPSPDINRMALLNLAGKPTKSMTAWFDDLHRNEGIDFVVIVFRKFEPENKISHRFLNGKQYGVGTYSKYPDAVSMFSFIGYYIFDTRTYEEIKINKNHDQYILTDLRLNNRMSYRELKDLPQKYLDLTVDKLTQIVSTRNVEIKRALLEYQNK